jgi:signal transduction histidine kinase
MRSENLEENPKIKSIIETIEMVVKKINNQILFTKDYQEIGVNAPTWQTVSELLTRCWQEYCSKARLEPKNASLLGIRLKNNTNGVKIYADPLLERAIHNLIDNTIRHAKKLNGQQVDLIKLDYRVTENNDLIISYQDNGAGIRPENKERIFEYGVGKNTGLGLFLIKEILEITDIKIQETGEYGKGACFEIIVPPDKYRFEGH